jgi:O-antigen ligase
VSVATAESARFLVPNSNRATSPVLGFIGAVFMLSLFIPVALTVGTVSGKPIDLIYADVLLPIVLGAFIVAGVRPSGFIIIYAWAVAVVTLASLAFNADPGQSLLVALLSSIRLYKCILYLLAGYLVSRRMTIQGIASFLFLGAAISTLGLLVSDIAITPGFPATRWGSNFLGKGTYGFPNTTAVYYVAFSWCCMAYVAVNRGKTNLFAVAIAVVASIVAIMTLSRSALVCLVAFIALVSVTSKLPLRYKVLSVVVLGAALAYLLLEVQGTSAGLEAKFHRTFRSEDATAGRLDIWKFTIGLISERPLLGYGFEPYSNYSSIFDTPHNQYLEIAYKGGLVAVIAFFAPVVVYCIRALKARTAAENLFGAFLAAVMVSAITQPNFTYAPTAALLFFWWGCLLTTLRPHRHERSRKVRSF